MFGKPGSPPPPHGATPPAHAAPPPAAKPVDGDGGSEGAEAVCAAAHAALHAAMSDAQMASALESAKTITLTMGEDGSIDVDVDGHKKSISADDVMSGAGDRDSAPPPSMPGAPPPQM